jgi:hypothetical protein
MMGDLTPNTTVTPDLIRGLAFLRADARDGAKESLTPCQARGDGEDWILGEGSVIQ